MSNGMMEKAATSLLLLDNLLAQKYFPRLSFFPSSASWRHFAHLCDTLPAKSGILMSAHGRIGINGELEYQNMGM